MSILYPDNDADLYLWPPDYPARPYWVSAQDWDAPESIHISAPVDGYYWLEIYGYDFAFYNLSVGLAQAQAGPGPNMPEDKPPRAAAPNSAQNWPSGIHRKSSISHTIALPLLLR
jgi:hypothetical protein